MNIQKNTVIKSNIIMGSKSCLKNILIKLAFLLDGSLFKPYFNILLSASLFVSHFSFDLSKEITSSLL